MPSQCTSQGLDRTPETLRRQDHSGTGNPPWYMAVCAHPAICRSKLHRSMRAAVANPFVAKLVFGRAASRPTDHRLRTRELASRYQTEAAAPRARKHRTIGIANRLRSPRGLHHEHSARSHLLRYPLFQKMQFGQHAVPLLPRDFAHSCLTRVLLRPYLIPASHRIFRRSPSTSHFFPSDRMRKSFSPSISHEAFLSAEPLCADSGPFLFAIVDSPSTRSLRTASDRQTTNTGCRAFFMMSTTCLSDVSR